LEETNVLRLYECEKNIWTCWERRMLAVAVVAAVVVVVILVVGNITNII
jgi:hypothetical protein